MTKEQKLQSILSLKASILSKEEKEEKISAILGECDGEEFEYIISKTLPTGSYNRVGNFVISLAKALGMDQSVEYTEKR